MSLICPNCSNEMEIKEVLTARTTSPEEDDTWEKMWSCECGHYEPISKEEDDC